MASGKVLYAVRMPSDLKRLLDVEAKRSGVKTSQLVVDACWKYLDIDGGHETEFHHRMAGDNSTRVGLGSQPEPAPKPDIAALRAIAAGNLKDHYDTVLPPIAFVTPHPDDICPHVEWAEDGEQYRCRLQAGHKGKCAPGERVS